MIQSCFRNIACKKRAGATECPGRSVCRCEGLPAEFPFDRSEAAAAVPSRLVPMRILVVDDEKKVAAMIRAGLEERGFAAEVCHDGNAALDLVKRGGFDALILDVMIPGRDGLSVLRKLREEGHTIAVLLLTARGDHDERVEGLNLGADDYLPKPFSMTELFARLNAVLRRRTGVGLSVQSCGNLTLNLITREVLRGGERIDLTTREFALLECLLRTAGKVVSRVELSQNVWGHQFDPGTNFVDVAMQRLRRKIDDPFPEKLIQTHRGIGYAIRSDQ